MQAFGNRTAATDARETGRNSTRNAAGDYPGTGRSGDLLPPVPRGTSPRRPVARRAGDVIDADFVTLPARGAAPTLYPVYPVFNDNNRGETKRPRIDPRQKRSPLAAIEARLRAMPVSVFALAVVVVVTGSFYASAGLNTASSGVAAPATLSVTTLRSDATGTTLLTVSGDRQITQRHTPPTITVDVIAGGKTISTTRVLAE